jgi:hypothetical protein
MQRRIKLIIEASKKKKNIVEEFNINELKITNDFDEDR